MHISVRGVIEKENGIILIHRVKKKENGTLRDYYVVPGGQQEKSESYIETLKREIKEELGITIEIKEKLVEYESQYEGRSLQVFYLCSHKDGIIGMGDGPEITDKEHYNGIFEPVVIEYDNLKNINLVPEAIKDILVERYQ